MENIKFTIEDSELAELLGRQNFSSKESAIFELLKNSYDAGANVCNIYIENDCIKIIDTGKGMNDKDIRKNWMHVGRSNKGYKDESNNRVLAGSKGVGRFALARLGNQVKVISKKENERAVKWETDWINSGFKEVDVDFNNGTYIEIIKLRDKWRLKDIEILVEFFNRACKSEEMAVIVHFDNEMPYVIQSKFKDLRMGSDYVTKIKLDYDSKNMDLTVSVESDEFKPEVKKIVGSDFLGYYQETFNVKEELKNYKEIEDFDWYIKELGDFSAEFYFSLGKVPKKDAEKFMYKNNVVSVLNTGIVLYRNNFSISSLDGKKDWLDIASRARKSPAAATHTTGSWRVRLGQISGFVLIDKEENSYLKDMANRQGLEENEFLEIFTGIIHFGISRFEKKRQSIIRKIDKNNKLIRAHRKEEKRKLDDFLNKPLTITKMSKREISSLADEIKDIQREAEEKSKAHEESSQQYKYDVRILNVLATQGLRASAIAHDLHNKRNSLATGYTNIINALIAYGFWEELNSERCTRVSYKNVPEILTELQETNIKLMAFIDVILNKIEKNKFTSRVESVKETIDEIIDTWIKTHDWIKIKTTVREDILSDYKIFNDVLEVIFDNLILNSVQHNEMKGNLTIDIEVEKHREQLHIKYKDDGIGLSGKYMRDPMRILEVHETSRDEGHGLGMWIVNNTVDMYDGEIIEINGEDGFSIYFTIKGSLK